MKKRKIVSIKNETITIPYSSLIVPSVVHTYSICAEVMKKWFLSKFKDDFFKSVQIDGSHNMNQLRGYNKVTILKRKSPSLYITPTIDMNYNRDNVDLYQFGANLNVYNGIRDRAFFKDYKHNSFISVSFEELSMSINYKLKFSTRAQQLDAYRYIQIACRAGATECLNFDMDMHVPYHLMLQLASDTGFKINDDNKIENIIGFMSFLNQNSQLPFLYKYRCINGNNEFFVRIPDANMHLNIPVDINIDDGTRVDQLSKNFGLEFTVAVNMMAPKFYVYHSMNEHLIIERGGYIESSDNPYVINTIKLPTIDKVDEHGWNQYLQTEYEEDELTDELCIHLYELFENSDIEQLLKYTIASGLSPAIFLNFRVYNGGDRLDIDIDFEHLIIHSRGPVTSCISNIIVYANLEYINEQLIAAKEMYKGRVN